jgi:hypothetical protein
MSLMGLAIMFAISSTNTIVLGLSSIHIKHSKETRE